MDAMLSAALRMYVGVTGKDYSGEIGECEYYEGIGQDGVAEFLTAINKQQEPDYDCVEILEQFVENLNKSGLELFNNPKNKNLPPFAERSFLAAQSYMQLAAIELQRCSYHLMQGQ